MGISSLIDTWLMLQVVRSGGERNRTFTIIKSRGMAHSNQTERVSPGWGRLGAVDTYLGAGGALTGAARIAKEAEDEAAAIAIEQGITRRKEERGAPATASCERQIVESARAVQRRGSPLERTIRGGEQLDRLLLDEAHMAEEPPRIRRISRRTRGLQSAWGRRP